MQQVYKAKYVQAVDFIIYLNFNLEIKQVVIRSNRARHTINLIRREANYSLLNMRVTSNTLAFYTNASLCVDKTNSSRMLLFKYGCIK